jgi:hypothetical protein
VGGQFGHPDRAQVEQRQQDRQLSQRQVAGLRSVGVAAAQHRKQLGEHALQLTGQFAELRFGLHHNSLV